MALVLVFAVDDSAHRTQGESFSMRPDCGPAARWLRGAAQKLLYFYTTVVVLGRWMTAAACAAALFYNQLPSYQCTGTSSSTHIKIAPALPTTVPSFLQVTFPLKFISSPVVSNLGLAIYLDEYDLNPTWF